MVRTKGKKTVPQKEHKRPVRAIKCRTCFMVDSYSDDKLTCRHCGSRIYIIDAA